MVTLQFSLFFSDVGDDRSVGLVADPGVDREVEGAAAWPRSRRWSRRATAAATDLRATPQAVRTSADPERRSGRRPRSPCDHPAILVPPGLPSSVDGMRDVLSRTA